MKVERIKSVTLLTTLKGTDEKGKPVYWEAGRVFLPKENPLPQSILAELSNVRKGGPIVKIEYLPDPLPEIEVKAPESIPDDSLEKKVEKPSLARIVRTPIT